MSLSIFIVIVLVFALIPPQNLQQADEWREVDRFGNGVLNTVIASPDGKHLAVGTTLNVQFYTVETTQMNGWSQTEIIPAGTVAGWTHTVAWSSDGQKAVLVQQSRVPLVQNSYGI